MSTLEEKLSQEESAFSQFFRVNLNLNFEFMKKNRPFRKVTERIHKEILNI
jgi:hypothetical protein